MTKIKTGKRYVEDFFITALIARAIIGFSVSFYVKRKIRNYNLRNLKDFKKQDTALYHIIK